MRFDEADGAVWNTASILARADVFNEGSFFGLPYKDGLNIPETPWWYPNVPAVMRTDRRGNPVAVNETWLSGGWGIHRSGCTLANEWNAFKCLSGTSYRRLVIESMDPDHEIRRVSPVALSSEGYTDLLNGQMDHGWCFSYTCLKRLMTFAAPVAIGTEYTVHFAATNPQKMRITLAHAAAGEKLIMKIYYQTSQRLNIFVGDKFVEDINMLEGQMRKQLVRNGQLTCNCEDCSGDKQAGKKAACYDRQVLHMQTPCKLINAGGVPRDSTLGVMCDNSGSVHGANTFNRATGMLELVVGQHGLYEYIDIVTMPTVQLTMSVSASVENFYEIKDAFISSIAGVLGIDVNRISIVDVVPGNARRRQRLPVGLPPPVRRLLSGGGASVDIEILPEAELSIADAVVWEDEGVVNVTVTRSVNVYPGVTVTVMSMQGNGSTALATAGVHFNQISTVIMILPLESKKTVAIPVHLIPGFSATNLTFVVRILNAENASITDSSASVTIGNVHSPQPGSPTLAAASPQKTSNSISIRWSAPEWVNPPSDEWAVIQEYQVQKAVVLSSGSVVPEQDWSTVPEQTGAATALNVSSLEVYTMYKFRVRGRTIKGWTEWSAVSGGIRSLASCGDGKRHASEECDTGDTVGNPADGCSIACEVLDGFSCAGGSESSADTCVAGCGNPPTKSPTEECDDGGANGDAEDGCRSCRIQIGWKCATNVNGQVTSGCTTVCGDGIRAGLEECDTNGTVGHGCNADCMLQSGAFCVENEDQLSHCRLCGNGRREEGEVCDDGSADAGCKNCSAVTAGWSCTGGSYTVPDQCLSGPAIPSAPFATSQTQTSITWTWSAVDGHGLPVSSYVFEYDVINVHGTLRKDPVTVVGTEWTASGLGASDQMSARVKACTAAGCSMFSVFSVPAAVRPPSAAAQLSSIVNAINADPAALLTGTNLSLTAPISVEAPSPEPEAPPSLPPLNMTEILAAAARLAAMNGTFVIEGDPPAPFESSTPFVAATPSPTPEATPEADSVLVRLVVGLPISLAEFTADVRLRFRTAIAAAAQVQLWRVFIVNVTTVGTARSRRVLHRRHVLSESLEVAVDIAAANATVAINMAAQLTPEVVRANLERINLPGATLVQLPACSVCSQASTSSEAYAVERLITRFDVENHVLLASGQGVIIPPGALTESITIGVRVTVAPTLPEPQIKEGLGRM